MPALVRCFGPAHEQYSAALITQMRERHTSRPEMTWLEMDVLEMQFGEDEFDLVVDKGKAAARDWTGMEADVRHDGVS